MRIEPKRSLSWAFNLGSAYLTGASGLGMQLRVRGYVGGVVLYDRTYAISASPSFIKFNYANIDQATFEPSPSGRIFVMDNLSI
jgi:hypothetical protein